MASTMWSYGNFTILSADGIPFKVEDYHLRSASTVFRDMFATGSGPGQIELTDLDIESSHTVHCALDFLINGTFHGDEVKCLVSTALFFKKYDCSAAIKNFIARIGHEKFVPRVKLFIVTAALDDEKACAGALDHPVPQWDGPCSTALVNETAKPASVYLDGSQLDTSTWSLEWVTATPHEYRWALDRGWKLARARNKFLKFEFQNQLKVAKAAKR
ncbi:hypothetical protein Q8F55_002743 [Vanrija albida]|uniref:BTB domain-containing protein n=1 Tax=Vanrija albida TaxID=181172 RepID=A0ABR3QAM7_9TREE